MSRRNPKPYTLSAMILGYILIAKYSANEQNAIGNWFMTVGQVLECNAAIEMAFEEDESASNISRYSDKDIEEIKKTLDELINKLNKLC